MPTNLPKGKPEAKTGSPRGWYEWALGRLKENPQHTVSGPLHSDILTTLSFKGTQWVQRSYVALPPQIKVFQSVPSPCSGCMA